TVAVQRVQRILAEREARRERAVVRTFASREVDRTYLESLVEYARSAHLFGHRIRLDEILVEPQFIRPPELITAPEEDVPIEEVFDAVPRVHDFPYLHAPYNINTLSIPELSRTRNSIILAGLPGSGRTTALLTIALWSAGFLEFEEPSDPVIQQLEKEYDPSNDPPIAEQIMRSRNRIMMAEATRARYKDGIPDDEDGKTRDPTERDEEVALEGPSYFRTMAPLYVHIGDIVLGSGEYGSTIDPAEPLIRALQRQTKYVAARRMVNSTYELLEEGNAMVLIDGYDDLAHSMRSDAMRWIVAMVSLYPDNVFIVAMPTSGYAPLMQEGAVPIYLRPWNDQHISDSVDNWVEKWEAFSKQPITFDRDFYNDDINEYTRPIKRDLRFLSALETTLRGWGTFKEIRPQTDVGTESVLEDEDQEIDVEMLPNESDLMLAYLKDLYPDVDEILLELQRLATIQLDTGFITLERLVDDAFALATGKIRRTSTNEMSAVDSEMLEQELTIEDVDDAPDYSAYFGDTEDDEADAPTTTINTSASESDSGAKKTDKEKEEEKLRKQIAEDENKILSKLVEQGVLVPHRNNRYQFRHRLLAAYLAAREMMFESEQVVMRKYKNPNWEIAMPYLAQLRDVDFLVAEQLDNPLDIGLEPILKVTNWLRYADNEASWRNPLLRYLGNLMAAQNQFTVVRERIAAALVGARDEGVKVVFRKSLGTQNTDMRRIASLALGAIRDERAIDPLTKVVWSDPDLENQIAGVLAMAAIGTEDALLMVLEFMEDSPNEEARRAAAESLATNREIGYLTLFDSLRSESITMRRAALSGVGRISTDWSWLAIDQTYQNDTEAFVRLAAEVVARKKFDAQFYQAKPYPAATEADWYINWVEDERDRGNIRFDMEEEEILDYALSQQQDVILRWLLLGTIGQVGSLELIDDVYKALADDLDATRDQAFRTLARFQEMLGTPLPSPLAR
ncbi:MAG: HEAT repeat domain-containing protein, partial [Chloroflexota bacterium]